MTDFFEGISAITYAGPDSDHDFAFRQYNFDEVVMGKAMKDHLRFSAAYWHSFAWPGDSMDAACMKADVAFEMFQILGVPYFCFHDADVRPKGATLAESTSNPEAIVDYFSQ